MCEGIQDNGMTQGLSAVHRGPALVKSNQTADTEMMDPISLNLEQASSYNHQMQSCPHIQEIFRYNDQIHVSVDVQTHFRFIVDLENAVDLLESDSFLQQSLGMACLTFLSDPKQVPKGIAQMLAYALIYRSNSDKGSTLGDRIQNAFEDYVI